MTRKTFDLGTTTRETELALPNELAGRRTAVFGISGAGKSNTATVMLEGLLENGEQLVLVDPKGEGWGLLHKADGGPSGLDVIVFGEPNGHIEALDETHGPRLADFVVQTGRSVVLSLLGFESDQSERRFVASFLRQLYRLKSRQAKPTRILVALEEAHLFVPEQARGDQAELSGAVQRIVRQGRSKGMGTLLIDQRPQDVAKRVLTQCETLVCHQLVHPLDRKALEEWVRGHDRGGQGQAFLESLASLQPGEGWVWSPAWLGIFERVNVRRRWTLDTGGGADDGPTPKSIKRADINLDELRGELADVVAKAEAEDPRKLQEQLRQVREQNMRLSSDVTRLELELEAQQSRPHVDEQATAEIFREAIDLVRSFTPGVLSILARMAQDTAESIRQAHAAADSAIEQAIGEAISELEKRSGGPLKNSNPAHPARGAERTVRTGGDDARRTTGAGVQGGRSSSPAPAGGGADLKPLQRAMLTALAQHPRGLTKKQVLLHAGYRSSGDTSTAYSAFSRDGWTRQEGPLLFITPEGLQALGAFEPLPRGPELRRRLLEDPRWKPVERQILRVAIEAYPSTVAKGELLERAGYRSSGDTSTAFSKLSAMGYLDASREGVKASPDLFPERQR